MADSKISALPPAATLTGTELVPVVQAGNSVRSTVSAVAALVNSVYTPPGVGAVATTVSAKLAQVVSVFDFMTAAQQADSISGAGTIDATGSIQAAINSLSASGGAVVFPAGAYLVSSVNVNKQCVLLGAGEISGATLIKPSGAANVVFNCTASGIFFRYISFNPFGVTQSGGAYIKFAAGSSIGKVEDCLMIGWFVGVWIAGVSDFAVRNTRLDTGVAATGTGIRVDSGVAVNLDSVICTNGAGARPFSGIQINSCGDVTMVWCQWIQCVNGCYISPGAGQVVASVHGVNTFFDNCGTYGLLIQPTNAGGAVVRTRLSQCWFSSSGTSGVRLDTATNGGSIDGVNFINPQIFVNGSHGFNSSGSGVTNVKLIGAEIGQSGGAGFLSSGGQSNIEIIGSTIGPIGAVSGNTGYAIQFLAGTSNNIIISNNRLSGNTAGSLSDASTGTGRLKLGNVGYNPLGTVGIAVTASPFTYTAGDTPETVYLNGGTVSLVNIGGINVFGQTNCTARVGPGTTVVVTYTVAPGMVTSKD